MRPPLPSHRWLLISVTLLLSLLASIPNIPVDALSDGLALTPPMGWNSWNRYRCDISENLIRRAAERLVETGLKAVGYRYVIVDDCWQGGRENGGQLFAHPQRFPRGIKALADYVHGLGLKFGLYSSRGVTTCAGLPGSQDFEVLDARTFAEWGVDFLKYDNCPYDVTQQEIINRYRLMRDALRQTGRPIIYGIIGGGFQHWYPEIAHLNRTAGDIQDNWGVVVHRFDVNAAAAPFARPGFWNDPDVLETGTGGMTPLEYRSQFSLWALSAAPLILSIDLERMNGYTLATLTNREVIAVNQDALGVQAVKISEDAPGLQVWAKRINRRGTWAIALFNRTEASADITVRWTDVGVLTGKANIRDLWTGQSGMYADQFKTMVVSHGVTLIKVCGVPKDTQVAGACG